MRIRLLLSLGAVFLPAFVLTAEEPSQPQGPNLVANGGFEGPEVARGWPRWWSCVYGLMEPGHVGRGNASWGLDETAAYEGRKSLRLTSPGTTERVDGGSANAENRLPSGTRLYKGRRYAFSAYLKSDRPNARVLIFAGIYDLCKRVSVGLEWQRYVVPSSPEADVVEPFVRIDLQEQGTLWIDAVQFEEGTEPTEYREWRE